MGLTLCDGGRYHSLLQPTVSLFESILIWDCASQYIDGWKQYQVDFVFVSVSTRTG
jgi:hypothetical protein